MTNTPSFKGRLIRDTHVMFAVNFADGRSAYIRVPPRTVEFGSGGVLELARKAQGRGEIPDGAIAGVKRVR
jgi:hypothetical protein